MISFVLAFALTANPAHAYDDVVGTFEESPAAEPADPRSANVARLNRRRGSFRRIIPSAYGVALVAELSSGQPGCGEAVRRVFKKGGSFYSAHLRKASTLLSQFPKASGAQDNLYYHFTSNVAFANGLARSGIGTLNGPVEDAFVYRRTYTAKHGAQPGYHSLWGTSFYLSEDQASLAPWYSGAQCVEFTIGKYARMISLTPAVIDPALAEIGARYPEVKKACGVKSNTSFQDARGTPTFHALAFIMAEESGIDAIDYQQQNAWFQFVNPEAFVSGKNLGVYHGGGGSSNVSADSGKAKMDYSYLTKPVLSVVSATYGKKDVAKNASDFIDGKATVEYKVAAKFAGLTPAEAKGAAFSLAYQCLPGGIASAGAAVKKVSVPEAEGTKITLSCSAAPKIVKPGK